MTSAPYVVRHPVDLIAIAPVVLGFVPTESVVLESFGGAASFHARVDLPSSRREQDAVARMLVDAAMRNDVRLAAVLVFSERHARALRQARMITELLRDAGVEVLAVLRVGHERYHRLDEDDAAGLAYDVSAHPFVAQRVFEGEVVHESREALVATLTPLGDAEVLAAVSAAATATTDPDAMPPEARAAEARWLRAKVRRFRRTRETPSPTDAGRMLALIQHRDLRDVAWAEMDRMHGDAHVMLWRLLLIRAPDRFAGEAAALLAFAAWLHGDGALAWCALDRIAEPDHVLASQVARALTSAMPPSAWQRPPSSSVLS